MDELRGRHITLARSAAAVGAESSTWCGLAAKLEASVGKLEGIIFPAPAPAEYQAAVLLVSATATDATSIGAAVAGDDKAAGNASVQKFTRTLRS